MERQPGSGTGSALAGRVAELRALDSIDTCRMRLVSLRTRIEANWPTAGGRVFRRNAGLSTASEKLIEELLVALPTPLPLHAGGNPESIISQNDIDLCVVTGRAVDAGLALLDCWKLDGTYPGEVSMFESHEPGALDPVVVVAPTVGLLVATIIGTLEAISERITPPPRTTLVDGAQTGMASTKPRNAGSGLAPRPAEAPSRPRHVPRI